MEPAFDIHEGLSERIDRLEEWRTKADRKLRIEHIALRISMIGTIFAMLAAIATIVSAYKSSQNTSIMTKTYEAQMMPHVSINAIGFSVSEKEVVAIVQYKNTHAQQPAFNFSKTIAFIVGDKTVDVREEFADTIGHTLLPPTIEFNSTSRLGITDNKPITSGAIPLYMVIDYRYENANQKEQQRHYKCKYDPKGNTCSIVYYN